ncbi:MAG: hypothetical protein RL329_1137 [Bacteroidota bacterium]|jgi:hypothetical protein
MKKQSFFLPLFFVFTMMSMGCSDEVTEPDVLSSGDELFCGKLDGSEMRVSKNQDVEIIRKHPALCSDWNVFHRFKDKDTFIFSFCPADCNERMNQIIWSSEGVYCAIFIENSNRFLGLNRLLLYKFKNGAIERKLDVKDKKISTFKFENDRFLVVTTKEGVETKTELD